MQNQHEQEDYEDYEDFDDEPSGPYSDAEDYESSSPSILTPRTDSSTSSKEAKPLSASDGAAFLVALRARNVATSPNDVPWQEQLKDLDKRWANVSGTGDLCSRSLLHAKTVRDRYWDVFTFPLVAPFFLTEWLADLTFLRFSVQSSWNVEPLECSTSDADVLPAPRPCLTIGFRSFRFLAGKTLRDFRPYITPVECDQALNFPFVTVETAAEGSVVGIRKNLYNAAVMLRNLRVLWEMTHIDVKEFDGIIRVLTFTISRNVVEVYGHWTVYEEGEIVYMHSKMRSWWLTDKNEDWYRARAGLEKYCSWISGKSEAWIPESLKTLKERGA